MKAYLESIRHILTAIIILTTWLVKATPMPLLTLDQAQPPADEGYFPSPVIMKSASPTQHQPRDDTEPYGGVGYLGMTFCSTGGETTCKLFYLLNAGCYADPLLDLANIKAIRWNKLNAWSCMFYDDMDCAWGHDSLVGLFDDKYINETTEDVRTGVLAWKKGFVAKSVRCFVKAPLRKPVEQFGG